MYDNHISSKEYKRLKSILIDMINGDDLKTQVEDILESIQQSYEEGNLSATQYDNLMWHAEDLNA